MFDVMSPAEQEELQCSKIGAPLLPLTDAFGQRALAGASGSWQADLAKQAELKLHISH